MSVIASSCSKSRHENETAAERMENKEIYHAAVYVTSMLVRHFLFNLHHLTQSPPPPSVLPPGPVQHLAVSGDLDGDVANLLVNWSAPVELYTDGEVWYDVLLSIGNGTFESADNRSLMYSAKVSRMLHQRCVHCAFLIL